MPKLVVIQTRFTLINKHVDKNAWRIGREGDIAATIEKLLNEDRLRVRANIFFNHTLPAIDRASSKGHSIIHTVLHYSDLPHWLLDLIKNASEKYHWFRPYSFSYDDSCDNYEVIRNTVKQWAHEKNTDESFNFAGVRLDDDDVIGTAYFEKLKNYIKSEYAGFAISFPKGIASLWEDNHFSKFSEFYDVKHAQGIAQINTFNAKEKRIKNPYLLVPGAHQTVDHRVPTILDSIGSPTYIRTFHTSNDIFIARQDLEKEYISRTFKNLIEFDELENSTF